MGNRLIRSELGRKFLKIGTCKDEDKALLIKCRKTFIKAGNDVSYVCIQTAKIKIYGRNAGRVWFDI